MIPWLDRACDVRTELLFADGRRPAADGPQVGHDPARRQVEQVQEGDDRAGAVRQPLQPARADLRRGDRQGRGEDARRAVAARDRARQPGDSPDGRDGDVPRAALQPRDLARRSRHGDPLLPDPERARRADVPRRERPLLAEQAVEERRGEEQLSLRRQRAAAVPAAPAVEELRAARPWQRQQVLGVGDCRRERAERRRIGGAASGGEERDRSEAARELERAAREVAVRDGIAGEVRREAEPDRGSARARRGPERRPDRRVERDDHRRWALLLVLLLVVPALVAPAPAAADDGGRATYTARGATYDFALRNTGTTAWQYFAVVAPPGASFVGGTTAVEGSARCVVGPPGTITCGPLSTFGFAPGSSMEFTAVLQSPIACGAPFGFSVSTTGAQPFT